MIVRELKLKPTKKQEATFNEWLNILTGLHNWGVRKILLDGADGRYYSEFGLQALTSFSSRRLGIPQKTMEVALQNVWRSWDRCFKKISKRPRLKGKRNPLNSIPFREDTFLRGQRLQLCKIGKLRYHKQDIPEGKIKIARVIKRASGWYCQLTIDAEHKFAVKDTEEAIGIDPGFSTLLTLSDGVKIENPRELRSGERRLGQAQRGRDAKLTARLRERQANRRKDRNHKISTRLVRDYKTIYVSKDNRKGMARAGFGKSVSEAGLSQLFHFLKYKVAVHAGRRVETVSNINSTKTCCNCLSLTGPSGRSGLAVRSWVCEVCGISHDRDQNSAMLTLAVGLGLNLKAARQLAETALRVEVNRS